MQAGRPDRRKADSLRGLWSRHRFHSLVRTDVSLDPLRRRGVLLIVAYDIADRRRWRRVLTIVEGYGDRLQLSVFQCRLTSRRRVELAARLEEVIRKDQDSVLFLDLGPADKVTPRVESLGRPFEAIQRRARVL